MARLWSCGFELQSVTSLMEWDTTTNSPTIDTTTVRSGAASLRVNPTAATALIIHRVRANSDTADLYVRFYLRIASATNALDTIFRLRDNGAATNGAEIRMNTDRTLEFWNGATPAQIGSDSAALDADTWYRIEVTQVGTTATAYIDGVQFASGTISTSANPDQIRLGAVTATTCDLYFDDIAVNDSNGSAQNGLPGEGKIVHLYPNADGDATTVVRGGSDSGSDFGQVDEKPTPNDATDYVELENNGDVFEVGLEASSVPGIGAADTISVVQVGIRERAETAALESWKLRIKSQASGTLAESATVTHNDTTWRSNGDTAIYGYQLTSYVDPQAGGAWTPALLDATQIGVEAVDATPDIWISSLWLLVEYVPTLVYSVDVFDAITVSESVTLDVFSFIDINLSADKPEQGVHVY